MTAIASPSEARPSLVAGLARLADGDRRLLKAMSVTALAALGLGLVYGFTTGLARAGAIAPYPDTFYRLLTLHGATAFFFFLYLAQATILLAVAAVSTPEAGRLAARKLAWTGYLAMTAGLGLGQIAPLFGPALLYDGAPELVGQDSGGATLFYLSYLLLAVGLLAVAAAAIATVLRPRFQGSTAPWPTAAFAAFAWAGLLMVSAIAAINTFLPPLRWTMGLGSAVADHATAWHVLFHNLHYLPLIGTVLIWYVLVEAMTGVSSIFGTRFSKAVFSLYLVLVPPTSLYHMFLEPGLAEPVRVAGSLLSLFVGLPTVMVFLVIVGSLEAHARARGVRGLTGWLRHLPWDKPAMAAIGFAVANLALGGAVSFVLIQERLAPLISDTFLVPGYFHFLTVGTVTLTCLAAFTYLAPALGRRPLWRPEVLRWLPAYLTIGLIVFGTAGVMAGFYGVPRRTLDVSYDGAGPLAWRQWLAMVGVGASVMAGALGLYAYGLGRTLLGRPAAAEAPAPPALATAAGRLVAGWTGPLSVAILLLGMGAITVGAFELMQAQPLIAIGGSAH